ncbi:flavin-dependent dehydrogenase [Prosthecobacter fusiformis]|uniref:Flavin-dependent dehydrogenase n=1 Tax=Prosthecobacter fusiformis TaxID=48464 RepID=A0A4R7S5I6_9BACT|nr:NAD(P)/FAD-dependent oxidoreductase [Prosthecobacter fusiformis]TDU72798.1 flavin-dependent dehydrogenase [Prosthecobacter fusiformis]
MSTTHDAIVIGGGPAGSSSSAILAEGGHRVLLLEREKFPRYHIGESLIPFTYFPLKRLGLVDRMKQSHFVRKYSVCFVPPHGRTSQPFYFFNRYDRDTVAETWQVLRSEFDQILLDNARDKGVEVHEQTKVLDLLRDDLGRVVGVRAEHHDGSIAHYHGKITLDCSGKEAFTTVRNGWRVRDPYLNKVAVWTYYQGSRREAGVDEGQTTVAFVKDKGWFWHIPQHNDRVSVGVVAEGKYLSRDGVKSPELIFNREVDENLWIKESLAQGEQVGDYFITSEYSHHAKHCGSEGLLLVGDAFAFLDPVFSSGLMFAMKSGVLAGEEVSKGLKEGDLSPERFLEYSRVLRQGVENMRKLVYAFYNPDFSFSKLIRNHPDAADAVTDCLSGDVNKDYTKLWHQVREIVPLPDDLPLGEPQMQCMAEPCCA